MDEFFRFTCESCKSLQPSSATNPREEIYLPASICVYCHQVITTETKRNQLDQIWKQTPANPE